MRDSVVYQRILRVAIPTHALIIWCSPGPGLSLPNWPVLRACAGPLRNTSNAKEEPDLDHCEARSWRGWHRHMTLWMAAAAFLARLAAQLRQAAGSKANERSWCEPFTVTDG
jgi:hypothetical protein